MCRRRLNPIGICAPVGVFDSGVRICRGKVHAEPRRRGEEKVNHRGTEDTEIKPARECAQNLPQCPLRLSVESLSPRLRASACPFLEKTSSNARQSCFPRTVVHKGRGESARCINAKKQESFPLSLRERGQTRCPCNRSSPGEGEHVRILSCF